MKSNLLMRGEREKEKVLSGSHVRQKNRQNTLRGYYLHREYVRLHPNQHDQQPNRKQGEDQQIVFKTSRYVFTHSSFVYHQQEPDPKFFLW